MQPKQYSKIIVLVFCLIWVAAPPVKGEYSCNDYVTLDVKSIYRICMPPDVSYNGKLVIWAHGFPFENRWTWYRGSRNDFLLNLLVPRRAASPLAVFNMKKFYNTSGNLTRPLVTIHTLYDQQVPYLHEFLYNLKTISQGSFLTEHVNIPISRFGHCNFIPDEALLGFGLMLLYAGEMDKLEDVDSILRGEELSSFESLAERFGLPYSVEGDKLRIK